MKPILVNVDYDEVLAGRKPSAARILALEFLAFWIVRNRPIRVHREYPDEYLDYIQHHTGHRPELRLQGTGENWWGDLKDIQLERKLNSKVWSFEWWQSRWQMNGKVSYSKNERVITPCILKRAQGMSGRGNRVIRSQDELEQISDEWFTDGAVLEPLYQRESDLSALWLPDEDKFIFYRNDIDDKFQWRGVKIERGGSPTFTTEEVTAMKDWNQHLNDLRKSIQQLGYYGPFSVDAFFYRTDGVLKFHPCSEINARKTMGWIAFEFYRRERPSQASLCLDPRKLSAHQWQKEVATVKSTELLLSPPDAPFIWIWSTDQ